MSSASATRRQARRRGGSRPRPPESLEKTDRVVEAVARGDADDDASGARHVPIVVPVRRRIRRAAVGPRPRGWRHGGRARPRRAASHLRRADRARPFGTECHPHVPGPPGRAQRPHTLIGRTLRRCYVSRCRNGYSADSGAWLSSESTSSTSWGSLVRAQSAPIALISRLKEYEALRAWYCLRVRFGSDSITDQTAMARSSVSVARRELRAGVQGNSDASSLRRPSRNPGTRHRSAHSTARLLIPSDQRPGWNENLSTRLRAFVAEDSGRFVGFAITMEVPASLRLAHFWQIRDLFVLPTHRRRGVGRALLASVRAAAIASGALRLVLQTEDDNDPLYVSTPIAATP